MTTRRDLALLRLAAHRLVGGPHRTPTDAVRWSTATQAQDLPGAMVSVALRTGSRRLDDVDAALDAGEVVRSWPMRGTLHLVPAEDLGWMLTLGPPRVANAAARRRADLGLDDDTVATARRVAVTALEGGGRLARDALMKLWQDAGVDPAAQRGFHLVGALAAEGLICLGPRDGRAQAVVLLDEWVPHPRRLGRDEALAEWALRYYRSHGPATVRDFAWWTGLTLTDARCATAEVADHLERVEVEGVEHLMDTETPALLDAARGEAKRVMLLPGFDEMVLGYADRTAVVPAEHSDKVVPGGNGMFLGTVVSRGTAVGTWRRPTRPGALPVTTPFTAFPKAVTAAVARAWAAYPRPA